MFLDESVVFFWKLFFRRRKLKKMSVFRFSLRTGHQLFRANLLKHRSLNVVSRLYRPRFCSTSNPSSSENSPEEANKNNDWKVEFLYDGQCNACNFEVIKMKQRNEKMNAGIKFVDISSSEYKAEEHGNISYANAMRSMHCRTRDGAVYKGARAFYPAYDALKLGWLWAPVNWPIIGNIADAVYAVWAKLRTIITGRGPLESVIEKHLESVKEQQDRREE